MGCIRPCISCTPIKVLQLLLACIHVGCVLTYLYECLFFRTPNSLTSLNLSHTRTRLPTLVMRAQSVWSAQRETLSCLCTQHLRYSTLYVQIGRLIIILLVYCCCTIVPQEGKFVQSYISVDWPTCPTISGIPRVKVRLLCLLVIR